MSTQHTPGPWQVRPSNNEITNADHCRLPFAIVAGYSLIGATYENGKDARLIAAAPDMISVLKELQESAYCWSEYDVPIGIVDRINAAIAKATGAV